MKKISKPADITIGKQSKQLPAVGCYLGWTGCSHTADIQVGDGWVCASCAAKMEMGV